MRDVNVDTVDVAVLAVASNVSDTASMDVWSLFAARENRLDAVVEIFLARDDGGGRWGMLLTRRWGDNAGRPGGAPRHSACALC